jgi:2'-5' RNA ligase
VRCFVALDLPPPVQNHLATLAERLRARFPVKLVEPRQLHLTLLFAGDADAAAVDGLTSAVQAVDLPPLQLRLTGFGHFPPRGVPRVLWAGIGSDGDALAALHRDLAARGQAFGIATDPRGFTPHVTIGRTRSEFGGLALIDALTALGAELRPKPFAPTHLSLYASELRPAGPVHRPLWRRPAPAPAT